MEEFDDDTSESLVDRLKNFNFENLFYEHRVPVALTLIGLTLIGFGVLFNKDQRNSGNDDLEILESTTEGENDKNKVVVEVSGAVDNPGVYELSIDARVNDAIRAAGGFSDDVDTNWISKFVNRAAKLSDGQKMYFPHISEQSDNTSNNQSETSTASPIGIDQTDTSVLGVQAQGLINVNTATKSKLESLWGIGPVTAQNIIDNRPYSTVEELLQKKILKSNVYERNKDLLTVY